MVLLTHSVLKRGVVNIYVLSLALGWVTANFNRSQRQPKLVLFWQFRFSSVHLVSVQYQEKLAEAWVALCLGVGLSRLCTSPYGTRAVPNWPPTPCLPSLPPVSFLPLAHTSFPESEDPSPNEKQSGLWSSELTESSGQRGN